MNIHNKYYLVALFLYLFISPIIYAKDPFNDISYDIQVMDNDIYKNIEEKLDFYKADLLKKITKKKLSYYYNNLEETIATAIYPYGYFNPTIDIKHRISRSTQITTIAISLGEPVITNSISITFTGEGADSRSLKKLLKKLPIKTGMVFRSIDYDKAKKMLNAWAANNGYIRAEFIKNIVDVNTIDKTSDIILVFDTKQRFYFGEVTISDVSISQELIKKYIIFKKSDVFTSKKIVTSYSNLSSSRLFQNINLQPDFSDTSNIIPVNVELVTRKKIGLSTSLGYALNRGLNSFISIDHRGINSKGHQAKLDIGYSSFLKSAGIVYEIPGAKPITDSYAITTDVKKININVGKSTSFTLGFRWSKKNVKWNKTISLNFSHEAYSIFKTKEKSKTDLIIPEYVVFRKKINHSVFPTLGYKVSWNINGAHKNLLSSKTYLQTIGKLDFIFTLMNIRFIQKNKIGGNFFIKDITELPPSKYFLEGGNSSIRGYDYQSKLIGTGKYVYLSSIDMQVPVFWRWYFTTFYDIGNVFDDIKTPAKSSLGVGVMFKTPIGPVNIGVAKALEEIEKDDPGYRLFFSIGSEI